MAGWLLLGPRGSRRIDGLQRALREQGRHPVQLLSYEALLADPALFSASLAQSPDALVKLESPGEAPALHAALVQRGWQLRGGSGCQPGPIAHGELAWQHFWYAGFASLLQSLPENARYLNPPGELACMADKLVCQQRMLGAGIPVPPLFGAIAGYEDMRERLRSVQCHRAFIKARYGSSGAGVLAYAWHASGREVAYGSAELLVRNGQPRVFNSLRLRRYHRHADIAQLVDLLAEQGAYLERWIPKPTAPGCQERHYDIRVVTLDGQPRQRVARVAAGALTNLHLGNQRGPLESWLDADEMACLESATATASAVFPRSRMIGFDLIMRGRRSWVLEANGFGDLLPGLHYQGRSTYQDQAALLPVSRGAPQEQALV